jgi:hypothetical protein
MDSSLTWEWQNKLNILNEMDSTEFSDENDILKIFL